jgi:three-Cys-motif partner protein
MPKPGESDAEPRNELFTGNNWEPKPSSIIALASGQPDELFDWSSWRTKLPALAAHSQAKLDVLRSYIEDYIQILCTGNPGQDRFRLTLVDGFAGGGLYDGGKYGSPFVLLQAVQVAEASLNQSRKKRLSIDCHFYFVESATPAAECLEHQLKQSIHAPELKKSIFLIRDKFDKAQERIVAESRQRFTRGGSRVIFFLDQCGYSDAPPPLLRSISEKLNLKAEFIVNLAIDWLTAYVRSEATIRKIFPSLGLEEVLPLETVVTAIKNPKFDPQYVVESLVGPAFQKVSGSPFFSPFYIQAPKSNRGYWLVHLAPQRRARSAMLDVYWRVANGCRHFGHTGLDMLTFKPDADPSGYLTGLEFGGTTRVSVLERLVQDFAREIRDQHAAGISYRAFHDAYCNRIMANEQIVREALIRLMQTGDIDVRGQKGGSKRVDSIQPDDIITPGHSPMLIPVARPPKRRSR